MLLTMLEALLSEIDAHLTWRAAQGRRLAETTFGLQAVNDGKLVTRLRAGGEITVGKAQRIREWMRDDRKLVRRAAQDAAA